MKSGSSGDNCKVANMDLKRAVNTAAEVPGEDEDSYTRSDTELMI